MTLPGLALFYGGLVRAENLLSVLMQCFTIASLVTVLWLAAGYSLTFSGDGAWIGDLRKVFCSACRAMPLSPADHPRERVLHVPDDLRHHHAGADRRAPSSSACASAR